jgi:hypothetical protein
MNCDDGVETFTAHCCFGDVCGKKFKRLGRFASIEEARQEIVRHLQASPKHDMSETVATNHVRLYTHMGKDDCCVLKTTEGPIRVKSFGSNKRKEVLLRSRSASREQMRDEDCLQTCFEADATVIEQSIVAMDDIVEYFTSEAPSTRLDDVPQLLADVRNIQVVLVSHVDKLKGVVANLRNYKN